MAAKLSKAQVQALGFEFGHAYKLRLEAETREATQHFDAFVDGHGGRLPSGLVPDSIKGLPGYATARSRLDATLAHERSFNGVFCPVFKKELHAHRQAAREARLSAAAA